MRLTPEQVAEEKKYLSELKERVWIGEHGLTSAEQDLFDTIEALQQANEQLQAQNGAMRGCVGKGGGGIGIIKNTHKIMLFNDSQNHRQSPCSDR